MPIIISALMLRGMAQKYKMYLQIDDIVFKGLFTPSTMEHQDTTTWAQHDLINAKPLLQPAGNDLEEISFEIKLRAEYCNPQLVHLQLKQKKDTYTICPVVTGAGRYLGDFVITELTHNIITSFTDGTVIESMVAIKLREYVVADKLQQQQSAARKQAFAVGDKKPVSVGAIQSPTVTQFAGRDLSVASSLSSVVDRKSSEYVNNISERQSIADKIQSALNKMDERMQSVNDALNNIELLDDITAIASSVNTVRQRINDFTFPISSLDDLRTNNRNLQAAMRSLSAGSIEILNLILTRAA